MQVKHSRKNNLAKLKESVLNKENPKGKHHINIAIQMLFIEISLLKEDA